MPGIPEPSLALLVLLTGIAAFAGLVHGALGIGFGLLVTALVSLVTEVREAVLISLLPTLAVNIASVLQGGRWRESIAVHWPLAVFAGGATILGTWVLIVSDPAPFKLALAGVIVLYLNQHRLGANPVAWVRHHPRTAQAIFGVAGGLMAGTVNVMVPVLVLYTLEMGLPVVAAVQVLNLSFMAGKVAQIGTFGQAGLISWDLVAATLPLTVGGLLALAVGMAVRGRVPVAVYRSWMRRLLGVVAAVLAAQFAWGLAPIMSPP